MSDVPVDLSDPGLYNDIYLPVIRSRHKYIVLYGGRDSAKSYTAAQKIIYDMLNEQYYKCIIMRKIHRDIRDSQFATLKAVIEAWGLEECFYFNESRCEIHCENGNMVLSRGLDRDSKLKSITDPTAIWFEEGNECSYSDFIKSDTSLRTSITGALIQVIITFNPEDEHSWIRNHFFPEDKSQYERPDGRFHRVPSTKDDTLIIHSTYHDNRWVSKQRKQLYEGLANLDDQHFYNVYCLGLWGNALKGLIFPNVTYVPDFPAQESWKKHGFGLDWGFTNDVTAICECVLAHGELWFKEHTYLTGLVNTYNERIPKAPCIEMELKKIGVGNKQICADSAEPKSVEEVRGRGFNIVGVKKPPGSVQQSITLMRRYKINIVGGAPNWRKEQRAYRYKIDKETDEPTNEPIDAWNHLWDAARMWVMYNIAQPDGTLEVKLPRQSEIWI